MLEQFICMIGMWFWFWFFTIVYQKNNVRYYDTPPITNFDTRIGILKKMKHTLDNEK
jgi:hypothetical protein